MGRYKKHLIKILVCFCLVYTPFFAHASAAEKWTIEEVKYNNVGKNLSYTASRPNAIAANDYVYKANVGVTAARTGSTVANMIRMGLAGAAIYGIVEGVGWVIENGAVVKKNDPLGEPLSIYIEAAQQGFNSSRTFSTKDAAITAFLNVYLNSSNFTIKSHTKYSSSNLANGQQRVLYTSQYTHGANNTSASTRVLIVIHGEISPETVPVSDSELGDAINNSPQAPLVLPDIYNPNNPAGGQAPQATDDALNSANPEPRTNPKKDIKQKPNKDTDDDGIPDVYDPSLPSQGFEFELPEFCSWAVTVCDWYIKYKEDVKKAEKHREDEQVVWTKEETHRTNEKEVWEEEKTHRTDEKTFWQKVEDFFDWTKQDPEDSDTELDIPEEDQEATDTNISFDNSCPAPITVPVSWNGNTIHFDFSFDMFCQSFGTYVKPIIIALGAFHAVLIVSGVRINE